MSHFPLLMNLHFALLERQAKRAIGNRGKPPVLADLFAPAVPIGRIPCGPDGMDYGTPTGRSWGVVYVNRTAMRRTTMYLDIPISTTS
jgi:hypothetical protein